MKRLIALALAALTLAGTITLTSCGKAAPSKPQNVFKETEIAGLELEANANMNRCVAAGDMVYLQYSFWDNETGMQKLFIIPVEMSTGTVGERIDVELEQRDNGGSSMNAFTADENGTLYLLIENYTYSETGYEQNTELRRIAGGKAETIDIGSLMNEETGEMFYISSLAATADGSLVLQSWNGVKLLTPDGKVHDAELDFGTEDAQIETLKQIDGKIYLSVWTYDETSSKSQLIEWDPATGKLGEELEINGNHIYNMILGPGYDYYYNDRSALWGINAGSDEMTEIINFVNSDINGNDIRQIVPLSADRFFLAVREMNTNGSSENRIAFLDRVPEDQIVEKKMLRLAASHISYDLRTAVIAFNKSNDEYRITLDDYSRYNSDDNWNAGIEKLNADIISGNIPDLFMLTQDSPYDTYASKGVFADLYALMDADESFDRSEYVESIWKAFEYDGELLSITPAVHISTFAAKESLVDGREGWTMDEFLAFAEAHPEMDMFDYEFNRETFLNLLMLFGRDQFIDRDTGKTSFDSDAFKALLQFAKDNIPEKNFWETMDEEDSRDNNFWMEYEERFSDDRVLLAHWTLYDLQYSFKELLNYSLKAEPALIGFPVEEGNGAVMQADAEYAIGRRSKFKEGAWEFLKTLIDEDSQMPAWNEEHEYWNYPVYGVPVYRPALDKYFEIAMTPPKETDRGVIIGGGAVTMPAIAPAVEIAAEEIVVEEAALEKVAIAETTAPAVDDEIYVDDDIIDDDSWADLDPYQRPMTAAQRDKLIALIEGTTTVARYDEDLQNIIVEEAAAFFAGTKSIDDTVAIINNRAGIYISESR
ncbi:MAG: extracellular solute-binding protein [Clostridia bacterium]|nr:extracellular solute-binding protein [Clostridia bacterium]